MATVVLFALALLTRFWVLGTPEAAVFDEKPYEEYVSHYFSGVEFFNLHPPAGELILALGARLLGIPFETLAASEPATALRAVPALAGTLIIPVFHVLLRQLGASRRVAFLGAFLLLLDNALLSVSRLILLDSIHLVFILGSLSAYLASLSRTGRAGLAFVAMSALLGGLAAGTKWSGLSALGIIGAHMAWRAYQARSVSRDLIREGAAAGAIASAAYLASFVIHFALLPTPNPGTSPLDPERNASIARKIWLAHGAMGRANASYAEFRHEAASPWWSWPILKHPIYAWKGDAAADGRTGRILIEGNPIVWWAVLVAFATLGAALLQRRARQRLLRHRAALSFLAACYLLNYAPFAVIGRTLFLYAYFPAFAFSLGLAVVGVGVLAGWDDEDGAAPWRFSSRSSAALYAGVAVLSLASFLYFAPITYGTPLSDESFQQRMRVLER